jgi:hypothetical protein
MPPAQMHGDKKGGVEWFVSTDGTDAGGNTIRVTEMTNYLSNTPNFTCTSLPVTQYQYAQKADHPGGNITVFPNTTTTQVHIGPNGGSDIWRTHITSFSAKPVPQLSSVASTD